jgi:hypothetical protein
MVVRSLAAAKTEESSKPRRLRDLPRLTQPQWLLAVASPAPVTYAKMLPFEGGIFCPQGSFLTLPPTPSHFRWLGA